MDIVRKTDRDALIEKLHDASQRTRLQSYVLETISTSLRDRQISPSSAMQWVLEEGLLDRLEEVNQTPNETEKFLNRFGVKAVTRPLERRLIDSCGALWGTAGLHHATSGRIIDPCLRLPMLPNGQVGCSAQAQLRTGQGILKVAREVGVGTGTVQRIKREMESPFAAAA